MAGLYIKLQKAEPAFSFSFTLAVAGAAFSVRDTFGFILCGYRSMYSQRSSE